MQRPTNHSNTLALQSRQHGKKSVQSTRRPEGIQGTSKDFQDSELIALAQKRRAEIMEAKERYLREKEIDKKRREIEERIQREMEQSQPPPDRNSLKEERTHISPENSFSGVGGALSIREDTQVQEQGLQATRGRNDVDTSRLLGEIAYSLEARLRDSIRKEMDKEMKKEKRSKRETFHEMDVFLAEEIASKTCAICMELMSPPDHTPNILFPCGHTYCMPCCKNLLKLHGSRCPECRSVITSHAINIPLKQLIESFVEKEKELRRRQGGSDPGAKRDDPYDDIASLWKSQGAPLPEEDVSSDSKVLEVVQRRVPPENLPIALKYLEDYKKFSLRSHLLHSELRDIEGAIANLGSQERMVAKRLASAQQEEEAIRKDIEILMQGLEDVKREIEGVRAEESKIQQQIIQSSRKLDLINGTLSSVESQKEKSLVLLKKFVPEILNYMEQQ